MPLKPWTFLITSLTALTVSTLPAQAEITEYRVRLSGEAAGVVTEARGFISLQFNDYNTIDPRDDTLSYGLFVADLDNLTMAHIHLATLGEENGPPVLWLYPAAPPPEERTGRFTGRLAGGILTGTDLVGPLEGAQLGELLSAIQAGRVYVNIHTTQNPDGEIRSTIE
jgi:hypothetical protein